MSNVKEYRVAVGNRIFAIRKTKEDAIETAKAASVVYSGMQCRVVYKNWNTYRGTKVYVDGKEVL